MGCCPNLTIRLGFAALGSALLAALFFLYEDEERSLQTQMEELWLRMDDAGEKATDWYASITVAVCNRMLLLLQRLGGESIYRLRFFTLAHGWCVSSFLLSGGLLLGIFEGWGFQALFMFSASLLAIYCTTAPAFTSRLDSLPKILTALALLFEIYLFFIIRVPPGTLEAWMLEADIMDEDLPMGYILELAQVMLESMFLATVAFYTCFGGFRWSLRRCVDAPSEKSFVVLLGIGLFSGLCGISPLLLSELASSEADAVRWLYVSSFLSTAVVVFLCFGVMALVALVHISAWSFTARAMYAMQRFEVLRRRRAVGALAISLIWLSLGPELSLSTIVDLLRGG